MIVQKYIVLLEERNGQQVWLGYDVGGRIGNASYEEAFRYDSWIAAWNAVRRVRMTGARWPKAQILGTTVETEDVLS